MNRRPSTQDITWLIDLFRNKQLDLEPPYQRRSVWTLKDKQFFLDTIFRNYPSPAIFLHKTITDQGKATYHVVDGKQRTKTILDFVADEIKIAKEYGDARLDGKRWSELSNDLDLKQLFWNYQITVEQIDFVEGGIVNEVFERLNRNSRKLTRQELRHAKYDGWLISHVESEAARDEWVTLGVVTKARSKRMSEGQFLSELMLVLLEGKILGFDQDVLDELYAKYDLPSETVPEMNEDEVVEKFDTVKTHLLEMEQTNHSVTLHAKGFGNLYTLWSLIALTPSVDQIADLAPRYAEFMEKVEIAAKQIDIQAFLQANEHTDYSNVLTYLNNSRGASTDLTPRLARLEALRAAIVN